MLTIQRMTAAHLPLLRTLRAQAGWNQTEDDLRRFLALAGRGAFVARWRGVPAGTVLSFVFGSTAWVAMVLVEESLRGRGIGTALMRHALAFLDESGVERVRLDATPLGRPVYEKLGFDAEYDVFRYAGEVPRFSTAANLDRELTEIGPRRLRRVIQFDAEVTEADRSGLLRALYRRRSRFRMLERGERIEGYISFRPGAKAWHVGPCLAADSRGARLLRWAFGQIERQPVYVDLAEKHREARAVVEALGLRVQRTLTRMCRGPRPAERPEMIWASSGPEKG